MTEKMFPAKAFPIEDFADAAFHGGSPLIAHIQECASQLDVHVHPVFIVVTRNMGWDGIVVKVLPLPWGSVVDPTISIDEPYAINYVTTWQVKGEYNQGEVLRIEDTIAGLLKSKERMTNEEIYREARFLISRGVPLWMMDLDLWKEHGYPACIELGYIKEEEDEQPQEE